ncbi:hypothetical protein CPT_Musica_037 [Burkholderia phage Musica]|uniref:Uncharacterized protein n=1 Tax=Burkholderia phage Musica TaxID=2924903 RepID=A0AAE9GBY7_9CAUD|nr:hypothetical protein CPT_Musica_037 [Burkholderia phage Musica]
MPGCPPRLRMHGERMARSRTRARVAGRRRETPRRERLRLIHPRRPPAHSPETTP